MNELELRELVDRLIQIGTALSSERELDVLLAMIVDESRRFTGADGGTLFLLDEETESLRWAIVQNDSMEIRKGGANSAPLDGRVFRPIALFKGTDEGRAPRLTNVAAYVAHEKRAVNIADVYATDDSFDFTGPKKFDQNTGYRTKSMLVVPLQHFDGGVVGVLQLINAKDPNTGESVEFSEAFQKLTASLASQAAVAVKNAQLFEELELQFEAFIRTIAAAIDEKSPYTAGHVKRVVDITMAIAEAMNGDQNGPFADVEFSNDELKALKIAAWMHDVGKITTPEYIVDKATKLSTIWDRIETIRTRYAVFEQNAKIAELEAKIARLQEAVDEVPDFSDLEAATEETHATLRSELEFLERCNEGSEFMADEMLERLEKISVGTWKDRGSLRNKLTDDELYNLSIRKGTLTREEIGKIRDHAAVSYKMLVELPFSRHLQDVPEIAAGHHEKLNGKGYPRGLTAEQLSVQARILAIADIFEALTAADRPYKRPTPLSGAFRILGFMIKDGELDQRIVDFAARSGVFDAYADKEVTEAQRDVRLQDLVD